MDIARPRLPDRKRGVAEPVCLVRFDAERQMLYRILHALFDVRDIDQMDIALAAAHPIAATQVHGLMLLQNDQIVGLAHIASKVGVGLSLEVKGLTVAVSIQRPGKHDPVPISGKVPYRPISARWQTVHIRDVVPNDLQSAGASLVGSVSSKTFSSQSVVVWRELPLSYSPAGRTHASLAAELKDSVPVHLEHPYAVRLIPEYQHISDTE